MRKRLFIFMLIPLLTSCINGLGDWKIGNYVDDFDEPTGEHFVYQVIDGTYSDEVFSDRKVYLSIEISKNTYTKNDPSPFIIKHSLFNSMGAETDDAFRDAKYIRIINKKERRKYIRIINKKERRKYITKGSQENFLDENFYDQDQKAIPLVNILLIEGCYDIYIEDKRGEKYRFSIDSQCLEKALIKAKVKVL